MVEDKIFTINLRREFSKKPIYRRAKKAVTAVKEFIAKHLKIKEVKIGANLNLKIWERGRRSPPPKVKVKVRVADNIAYVELPEFEFSIKKEKEEKKTVTEKVLSKKETEEEAKKEKEKELNKELADEEKLKQKREHKPEVVEKPSSTIKPQEKVVEDIQRHGRVIGSTGKKGAKESKP